MQAENLSVAVTSVQPASKTTSLFLGKFRSVLLLIVFLLLVQHTIESEWSWDFCSALALFSALGCVLLWHARRGLVSALCSVQFAVVLAIAIALGTALGTFIPQNETIQGLEDRFGESGVTWIQRFFLDDLFHSFWFCGLLALLALSLTLVVLRRPFWRPSQWGFLLTHGGMVALLCGALIGNMFGIHGNLELRVGTDSTTFVDEEKLAQPLGFTLKLDKFDIEKYPTEYRMYVFAEGDKHYSVTQTASIKDCADWTPISGTDTRYRVAEYYPDIQIENTLKASNDPSAPSGVSIKVLDGKGASEKWILAGPPTEVAKGLQVQCIGPGGRDALAAATGSPTPEKHLITIDHNTFEVRLGQTYTAPGTGRKFTVVEFLPDFYYDFQKKGAATRGTAPNNPALGIEETTAGKTEREWLFANMPGHGHKPDQLDVVYKYVPPVSPIEHLWAIDSKTQELLSASGGKIVSSQPLAGGLQQQVSIPASEENGNGRVVTIELLATLDHAVPAKVARTLSQEPKNPGVLVEVKRGDSIRQAYLMPDADSVPIEDGLSLAFKARSEQPKAYKSYVSVVSDEGTASQATIAVNAPLKYNGYTFYQSGYRSDKKGDFSSFRVVNDPGLGAVYVGMIMVALGVIYTYYVRPRQTAGGNSRLKEGLS